MRQKKPRPADDAEQAEDTARRQRREKQLRERAFQPDPDAGGTNGPLGISLKVNGQPVKFLSESAYQEALAAAFLAGEGKERLQRQSRKLEKAATKKRRGRPPEAERRKIIMQCADLDGREYAKALTDRGLRPPPSWQLKGKPELSYLEMWDYKDHNQRTEFRNKMDDERYNYSQRRPRRK